ncbi:glycosyltransferase family 32 protein [Acetobacterium sp.]|uniref:glycosyltransferase family 32 protein n=1 Tax=Acetobacterium sp. TaxID=1872094 RepID=UPI003593645A
MAIPKKIHYVWVGNGQKSPLIQKCIDSWKRVLPDYDIIEWNESNYDIHKNPYIDKAYSERKWAFVADYIRFDVLYEYGGIYFDTDVELIREIPETIIQYKAFAGFEDMGYVNPGLVFACEPRCLIVKEILDSFDGDVFDDKEHLYTINERMSDVLDRYGLVRNNQFQIVEDIAIYPSDFFCAYDQILKEPCITDNTISVHHYAATWRSNGLKFKMKLRNIIKHVIGRKNFIRLIELKQRFK